MTQQEVVQLFQDRLNHLLATFEAETGYRANQTAALPPALKAVLEAAGAPSEGWKVDAGWQFIPMKSETE